MIKKQTNLERQVSNLLPLMLEGHLLCIDPSSGSRESMPGYAIYKAGQLVDSGFIQVSRDREFNRKLFQISACLRESFEEPDILIVENIPPFIKSSAFSRNIISLHRAVGAIIASWDKPLVEVPPVTWHKYTPDNYEKTDERDAIMIGYAALVTAYQLSKLPIPPLPDKIKDLDK